MPGIDRYQRPELIDSLAGQYVLGTLRGSARKRFMHLMRERPYINHAVEEWQARLNPLGEHVVAVQPPARVWKGIRQELRTETQQPERIGFWRSLTVWRSAAVAASLLVASLVVFQVLQTGEAPSSAMPHYMAVLENSSKTPMIVATASSDPRHLKVMMMDEPNIDPSQDWELWAIPEGESEPMSIGLIARGKETKLMLDQEYWDAISNAKSLAISAEPLGGSPTGTPTGPVMYSGHLMSFVLKG